MNKRQKGSIYESRVCDLLSDRGYKIIERNFISRYGEIDIIALREGFICFVEVKYRKNADRGMPEEAISTSKIRKICRTSTFFLCSHRQYSKMQIRFDVATVLGDEISYYENAFDFLN